MMLSLTVIIALVCGFGVAAAIIVVVVIAMQNQQIKQDGAPLGRVALPLDASASLEQRLLYWLGRGNKIEAIKVYRQTTGVGLKEAKDAVEAFERGEPLPALAAFSEPVASPQPLADLREQVRFLLQQDKKIEAIKVYREATGVGLKEAKDAVEAIERM